MHRVRTLRGSRAPQAAARLEIHSQEACMEEKKQYSYFEEELTYQKFDYLLRNS